MKRLIIISIAILTTLSCCTKEDLKPEDYKFYCKVDGVVWKRTGQNYFCPGCSPLQSDYYASEKPWNPKGLFEIRAHLNIESKGIREYLYFSIWGGLKEGVNNLTRTRRVLIDYEGICRGKDEYDLDSTYNNQFIVNELDTINRRITGTFDLRVVSYDCTPPDTIRITEGHFDLNPVWHP